MADFTGRIALVTGAASGIGLATARLLAVRGASLILVDRIAGAAELGRWALGDVADETFWDGLDLAGLDLAVVNAGVSTSGAIADTAFAEWRRTLAVNLDGAFLTLRAAMRAMAGRPGAIVVTGSGRDPDRCAAAELRAVPGQRGVDFLRGDRIDVLVDNAGGMAREPAITEEGLEENFAANHLGPFLLTQRLLPLLRAAAANAPPGSVRIVVTASDAGEMIPRLDFDDLQSRTGWNPGKSYCRAKLANMLFARGLAKRLAGDGIVGHAMHPGYVESNFITHAPEQSRAYMRTLTLRTPEQGVDTPIWLATAPQPGKTSGGCWSDRAQRTPNPVVESEKLVAQVGA